MNQKMICQRGTCSEEKSIEPDFDILFENSNIVREFQNQRL